MIHLVSFQVSRITYFQTYFKSITFFLKRNVLIKKKKKQAKREKQKTSIDRKKSDLSVALC